MNGNNSAIGFSLKIPENLFSKLDRLNKQINSISSDSEKMATHFNSAMVRMGQDIDGVYTKLTRIKDLIEGIGGIKITGVESIGKSLSGTATEAQRVADGINQATMAIARMGDSGITNIAELKRKIAELKEELTATDERGRGKLDLKAQQEKVDLLRQYEKRYKELMTSTSQAIELEKKRTLESEKAKQREIRQTEKLRRQQIDVALQSADPQIANTFVLRKEAIKNLEAAMKNLNTTDKNYNSNMDKLSAAYKRLNKEQEVFNSRIKETSKSQRHLLDISGQLLRKLALVFSISQLNRYAKSLVNVRGEFELQNKALGAILQNKNLADKLYKQVMDLSVKSPFRFKDLITYTKQLAAFRFENDKLYDTMKRLADVSAGLGVDMQRLILAMGQVKAANYLRGQELRQFSEAGVNILGELAKRYSELEKRTVSTGEVFERVSKRMVLYKDVEEVFDRITREGGTFYRMQEIQAETLRGIVTNLRDSVDIMLNEMGTALEPVLKGWFMGIRNIVDNWKQVGIVIASLLPLLAPLVISTKMWGKGINLISRAWGLCRIAISRITGGLIKATAAQEAFNTASKANLWVAAASVIISAVTAVALSFIKAGEQSRKFDHITREGLQNARELVAEYKLLGKTITDTTISSTERNKAMETLHRVYDDILPREMLEIEYLKKIKDNYAAVTRAIYSKTEAEIKAKLIEEAQSDSSKSIEKAERKLMKDIEAAGVSEGKARLIIAKFEQMVDAGTIRSIEESHKAIFNLIKDVSGLTKDELHVIDPWGDITKDDITPIINRVEKLTQKLLDLKEQIEDIQKSELSPDISPLYRELSEELKKVIADAKKDFEENEENKIKFPLIITYNEESKKHTKAAIQSFIDNMQVIAETKEMNIGEIGFGDKAIFGQIIEDAINAMEKIDISPLIAYVDKIRRQVSEETKVDFGELISTEFQETESVSEYLKKLNDDIKEHRDNIENINKALKKNKELKPLEKILYLGNATKTVEEYTKETKALEKFRDMLMTVIEKGSGSSSKALTELRQKINLIEEMNREYKKLRKSFSEEESTERIKKSYALTAKDLGIDLKNMKFDDQGVIDTFDQWMEHLSGVLLEEVHKHQDKFKVEVDINAEIKTQEDIEKQFGELFAKIDLSQEVDKLGVGKEFSDRLKEIFNIDEVGLDDVREALKKFKEDFIDTQGGMEKASMDAVKFYNKINDEIAKREKQNQKERLVQYKEYLQQSMTEREKVTNQANIERQQAKDFFITEEGSKLSPEEQENIIAGITAKEKSELAKIDFEVLKSTDLYKKSFEDLNRLSVTTLNAIIEKLQEFADKHGEVLDPSNFKEIMNNIQNVRKEIESRNPFTALIEGIQKYYAAKKEVASASKALDIAKDEEAAAQADVAVAQATLDTTSSEDEAAAAAIALKQAREELAKATEELRKAEQNLSNAQDDQTSAEDETLTANNRLIAASSKLNQAFSKIVGIVKKVAENLGFAFNDETNAVIDGFTEGFQVMSEVLSVVLSVVIAVALAGEEMQLALWPLLIIGAALGAIFAAVKLHDAKREKIIKNEQERVKQLEKEYEAFHETVKTAISFTDLEDSMRKSQAKLRQEIASYQTMIAAEEDKKKKDEEKIKEWEDEIAEINQQFVDDQKELLTDLGGFDEEEMKNLAEDLSSTWLEAFLETEDGLDALNKKWEDVIKNIISKQLMLAVTKKYLKPVIDQINASLDDLKLTPSEAQKINSEWGVLAPQMNDALKQYAKIFEDIFHFSSNADGTLSELQKGIQGITETTAEALEALLNSIRFFVADSNFVLNNMYNMLLQQFARENPLLSELKEQTKIMIDIREMFENVTTSGHSLGGSGIKVIMSA